jgi:hypothetical protein
MERIEYSSIQELKNIVEDNISSYKSIKIDSTSNTVTLQEKVCVKKSKVEKNQRLKRNNPGFHKMYTVWRGIVQRCYNKNHMAYRLYGQRGILMDDEWRHSPNKFYDDMYPSYIKGYTLDRIDNNKGYSKSNCKWSTQSEQCRNTCRSINIIYEGSDIHLLSLIEKLNIEKKYAKYIYEKCRTYNIRSWERYIDEFGVRIDSKTFYCRKHFLNCFNITTYQIVGLMERYCRVLDNIEVKPNIENLNWYIKNIGSFSENIKKVSQGKKIYKKDLFI